MLSKETAASVWNCYREIEAGNKLLLDTLETIKKGKDHPILDQFGRVKKLQLGVPMDDNSSRLLDVSPTLAVSVIKAHIAEKEAELIRFNEQAKIESSQ
jgi:hypothetical protein